MIKLNGINRLYTDTGVVLSNRAKISMQVMSSSVTNVYIEYRTT